MMNNTYDRNFFQPYEMQYQEELSDNSRQYHVSIEDFTLYLKNNNEMDAFQKNLEEILKNQTTLEYVAVDYEIPVIMIKYFISKRVWTKASHNSTEGEQIPLLLWKMFKLSDNSNNSDNSDFWAGRAPLLRARSPRKVCQ